MDTRLDGGKTDDLFDKFLGDLKMVTNQNLTFPRMESDGYGNQNHILPCDRNSELDEMRKKLSNLRLEVETLKGQSGGTKDSVEIGGYKFTGRDNLLLWTNAHLPPIIPYGCFVDIYTFLNRMIDGSSGGGLSDLVSQHKLGLGGDNSITLQSFQSPLPRLFGNMNTLSELKSSHNSSIPSMPTSGYWEDPMSSMGIKDCLKKQIPNIKAQIQTNIGVRLSNHPVGYSVAVACLEATITFLNTLISWISDTNLRLTSHGDSKDLSWKLITQVIYHIFTGDLDKSRNFVRDSVDTSNTMALHSAILWGIFKTHEAMQSYMSFGIGAHPGVASQYLDFLVNSRGEDSNSTDSKALWLANDLDTKVKAVEKVAKEAKATAGSANNAINQLKSKVNNMRSAGGNGGNQA